MHSGKLYEVKFTLSLAEGVNLTKHTTVRTPTKQDAEYEAIDKIQGMYDAAREDITIESVNEKRGSNYA